MRAFIFLSAIILQISLCMAQNVGIGTNAPSEKLDVNGNTNIAGQLKMNGNAGTSGQVLMKDASNNPVWGDISAYKNMIVFDCSQVIGGGGAGNCSDSWTVPAGVTKILVECWGGGGGGGTVSGAGGGGYVSAVFIVAPGNTASVQIGAGGSVIVAGTGITGGTTFFSINGMAIFAEGGTGAFVSLSPGYSVTLPAGGGFLVSGIVDNYIGFGGAAGLPTKQLYSQVSATVFSDLKYYGDGGDAALLPGSGGKGGFSQFYISLTQNVYAAAPKMPGGGGAADPGGGTNGKGGRIIIHY